MYQSSKMRFIKAIVWAIAIGSASLAGSGIAMATPVNYQFALKPTSFGNNSPPILGFSSLPANPFIGTFSIDSSLLTPNRPFGVVSLLAFALNVGTQAFTNPPINLMQIATDGSGAVDAFQVFWTQGTVQLNIDFQTIPTVDGWSAWDHSNLPDQCGLSNIGGCIGGFGPQNTGVVTLAQVPEPATLTLFGTGVLCLVATHRRRKARKAA